MRVETIKTPEINNSNNLTKNKKTNVLDAIFEKMLQTHEDTKFSSSTQNINKVHIPLKTFLEIGTKIEDPKLKKLFDKAFSEFVDKNVEQFKKTNPNSEFNLTQIKQKIFNGEIEHKIGLPTKFIDFLEKKLDLKEMGMDKFSPNLETVPMNKNLKPIEKESYFSKTTDNKEITTEKNNEIDPKTKNKESFSIPNIDIFEELKKSRLDSNQLVDFKPNTYLDNNNYQAFNVKTDKLKLSDWIESFKNEISRLSEFKVENTQKVSMLLKEQDEELRIIVEKRDSYIFVKAQFTENMKDKLDNILYEVQSDMKEKGIELKIEINREEEDRKEEQENEEDKNKYKQNRGGKKNDDQHSESGE